LQIVIGLLCSAEGCPVAVEVFDGNTGDPTTLSSQVEKVRRRFGLTRLVFVGDRGLITEARIREELRPVEGLDWITALRSPQIRALVERGTLQLLLFDEQDLASIAAEASLDGFYVIRTSLPARDSGGGGDGPHLQEPGRGGACLPLPEDGRPQDPTDLPPAGRSSAR
jgi:hypothetical protein